MTDFNRILAGLNTAGYQIKEPAIYQAISQLIKFSQQSQTQLNLNLTNLQNTLGQTFTFGLAAGLVNNKPNSTTGNIPLYYATDTNTLYIFANSQWNALKGFNTGLHFLTSADDSLALPNSRQLLAGTGISFNDTVANQRTVTATGTAPFRSIGITIGDGVNVITTGIKGAIQVPFTCTILSWTILSTDPSITSGSISIDILKSTYAGYSGSLASIVAAAPPAVTTATKNTSSTLTGWTTAITAGDVIQFNVSSITSLTRAVLQLRVQ